MTGFGITFGMELLVGLVFLAVMMGYGWGRRHGRRDGFIEGLRYAPLEMRRLSLEKGGCIICGTVATGRSAGPGHPAPSQSSASEEAPEPAPDIAPHPPAPGVQGRIPGEGPDDVSDDAAAWPKFVVLGEAIPPTATETYGQDNYS